MAVEFVLSYHRFLDGGQVQLIDRQIANPNFELIVTLNPVIIKNNIASKLS